MIFLTSAGFTNPNVFKLLKESSLKPVQRACIIANGMQPLKEKHPIALITRNYLVQKGLKEVDFYNLEFDDPNTILKYDIVTILGGNSCVLFNLVKKTGIDVQLRKMGDRGSHIIGASAGAMLLSSGNKYTKYFGSIIGITEDISEDTHGLGFTDDVLFPHYDMLLSKVKDLEQQLCRIELEHNIKIVRLKNMDFIYVDSDGNKIYIEG
ncbi:MAG: Type 1 glutamine amidotransferase-like domain-containing protein [Clostridia bacterium]|nr:Type 1 glutamine amidotransferase-like domain-containing protein [Clostridia bacterium]